jgi:hypothetical protein
MELEEGTEKMSCRVLGLSELPTEVLQHALSFVDPADLCRLEALNRDWRRFVSDETIWRHSFAHHFGGPPQGDNGYALHLSLHARTRSLLTPDSQTARRGGSAARRRQRASVWC